ncbi:MAG: TIGR03435 family protein [Terracidiphilus sp.]
MLPESLVRTLGSPCEMLSRPVFAFALAFTAAFALLPAAQIRAQAPAAAPSTVVQAPPPSATPANPQDLTGTWQGTLHAGQDLRLVLKVTKGEGGAYAATAYSIDQGGASIPVSKLTLESGTVKMAVAAIGGTYEGKMSSDGNSIVGNWSQGPNPLPLTYIRATPATEWTIPTPPPPVPPMAANADPGFDVATIKPSEPGKQGKGFGFRAGHFVTFNTNMNDLIAFAYGLHSKQIVDAPAWFGTDLFDIEAKPDTEGRPNLKQMGIMVQKLLTERFQLKFHHDQRELSVYAITVAPGGPKMTKSTAAPTDPQGFGFRALGDLNVRNMNMKDFATWMQSGVMDRPVVDQTGLTDRYDFPLKWTPDDSQFAQFRGVVATPPPPTEDPNAPPSLYTAVTEQLGLKIGPAKLPDDVIVIDHAEKPSAN